MSNETGKNRIRILTTSDVHGKICPWSYGDGSPCNYGFAKLYPIIRRLRDENTILIDNGDTLEGSPLQMHHFKRVREGISPVTKVMKEMGYDYINLGNHDFDFGLEELKKHIVETGGRLITSNIRGLEEYPLICAIKEICGKRIGIFGITTHFVPRWEREENVGGLAFRDAFDTAKEIAKDVREKTKADYIVCVYHGGFERDPETGEKITEDSGENQGYKILKEIEDIDILITGHQHRLFCGVKNGTAYTQPGVDGNYLSSIEIDLDTGEIVPSLIPVGDSVDEGLLNLVEDREKDCQKWLDEVIGSSKVDISVKSIGQCRDGILKDEYEAEIRLKKPQIASFVNQVQIAVCKGDLAAFSIFSDAKGLGKEITIRDLVSTYKFSNTLTVKRVTGKVLRAYLEKNMEFWIVEEGRIKINPEYLSPIPQFFNYDLVDGIEYTAKISNPVGERIVSLSRNGLPVTDDMEFDFVLNNYRASGGGGFEMFSDIPVVRENLTDMVEILMEYIRQKKIIDFDPVHNINIII